MREMTRDEAYERWFAKERATGYWPHAKDAFDAGIQRGLEEVGDLADAMFDDGESAGAIVREIKARRLME